MKLSLRKANALQLEITQAIGEFQPSSCITLTEYSTLPDVVTESNTNLAKLGTTIELTNIVYDMRKKIAIANAAEINSILTNIAHINKLISLEQIISSASARETDAVINAKIQRLKTPSTDRYSIVSLNTPLFHQSHISKSISAIVAYRRIIVGLKDRLLELNISTQIELEDKQVKTLQKLGII